MFVETQQLYCARSHPLFGYRYSILSELREQGFVLTGADEVETITRLRQRHRLGTVVTGLADDIHEAMRLISLGVGIGFLPTMAASEAVRRGELWPLLPEESAPSYEMHLLARLMPSRDTATQLFLDEITRRLRAMPR